MHYEIEVSVNNSDATSRISPKGGFLPFKSDFALRECILSLSILHIYRGAIYIFFGPKRALALSVHVRALALTLLLTAPSASLRTH